jgi:hypothetical protein
VKGRPARCFPKDRTPNQTIGTMNGANIPPSSGVACSIGHRSSNAAESGVRITPPNDSPLTKTTVQQGVARSNQRVINVVGNTKCGVTDTEQRIHEVHLPLRLNVADTAMAPPENSAPTA